MKDKNGDLLLMLNVFAQKHVVLRDWGEAWTVLTNMALSLGQLLWQGERTLKEVRDRCYIDPVPPRKNSDGTGKHVNMDWDATHQKAGRRW